MSNDSHKIKPRDKTTGAAMCSSVHYCIVGQLSSTTELVLFTNFF